MEQKLIFIFVLLFTSQSACDIQPISEMAAGYIEFTSSSNNIQFSSTFKTSFDSTPRLAFGIWNLTYYQVGSTPSLKLQVGGIVITPFNMVLNLLNFPEGVWQSITIGYLASTRNDFILGSSHYHSLPVRGRTITHKITPILIPNYGRSILRTFLNGFSYSRTGGFMEVQVQGSGLSLLSVQVKIIVQESTSLTDLWFSYVIFSPPQMPFASDGRSIIYDSVSEPIRHKDLHRIIHFPEYLLGGMTRLGFSSPFSMKASIDTQLIFSLLVSNGQINVDFTFILLTQRPATLCSQCSEKYPFENQCVDLCPDDTYLHSYIDKGKGCHRCSPKLNEILNENRTGCGCQNGFKITKQGKCELIEPQQQTEQLDIMDDEEERQRCAFLPNSYWSGYRCTCKVFYRFNSQTSKCEKISFPPFPVTQTPPQKCPPNSLFNGNRCRCIEGYTMNPNNQCQKILNCSSHLIQQNGVCVCANNAFQFDGRCISTCPFHSIPVDGKCVCEQGFIKFYSICVSYCPDNSQEKNGQCVCKGDAELIDLKCIKCVRKMGQICLHSCPVNSFENGQECICLDNYTQQRNQCILNNETCGELQFFNFQVRKCECLNNLLKVKQKCVVNCPPNSYNVNNSCICISGYIFNNQHQCVQEQPCPQFSFRVENKSCQCIAQYAKFEGECVEKCPKHRTNLLGKCICNSPRIAKENECICPPGMIQSNDQCLCGTNQSYNLTSKTCECLEGYGRIMKQCKICQNPFFLKEKYCVMCPVNSYLSTTKNQCICKDEYQIVNNICVSKCTDRQIYLKETNKCVCKEGLGFINGICQVCPPGTIIHLVTNSCTPCPPQSFQQGGICKCKDGFSKNGQNNCIKCEDQGLINIDGVCGYCIEKSRWNGTDCKCLEGTIKQNDICRDICNENENFDPQNGCYVCTVNEIKFQNTCLCKKGFVRNTITNICELQCKPGYFQKNGLCAKCSLNLIYDPTLNACLCPSGYYLSQNALCEKVQIVCKVGEYLDPIHGCLSCPRFCSMCTSKEICKQCQRGFQLRNDTCESEQVCGNKILENGEECDDGNDDNGDGCSSKCKIQQMFMSRKQSSCGNGLLNTNENCDDGNIINGDGCSEYCKVQIGYECNPQCRRIPQGFALVIPPLTNAQSVFLEVQTRPRFDFASKEEMRNFIQYKFGSEKEPSFKSCLQKEENPAQFKCFFFYPEGVQKQQFDISLWYEKDGYSGWITVVVDSSKSVINTRSLV